MAWQVQELLASAFLVVATATLSARAIAGGKIRSLFDGAALAYMVIPAALLPAAAVTRDPRYLIALAAWLAISITVAYPIYFSRKLRAGEWDDGFGRWLDRSPDRAPVIHDPEAPTDFAPSADDETGET